MGYSTWYTMESFDISSEELEKSQFWNEDYYLDFSGAGLEVIRDSDPLQLEAFEPYKWYDWPKDMKKLSEEFPNVMFILQGQGEEPGDIWAAAFKNGERRMWSPPSPPTKWEDYEEIK